MKEPDMTGSGGVRKMRSAPLTVITPVPKAKSFPARLFLAYMRRFSILQEVRDLKFIHFARWQRITRSSLPTFKDQPAEEDGDDLFVFSTNFNGPWNQYIDTFSRVDQIRKGIKWLWWFSDRFPGPVPIRNFKSYINYHTYDEQLYYDAYPDATVRDIAAALSVAEGLRQFIESRPAAAPSEQQFADRYLAFLQGMANTAVPEGSDDQSFLTAMCPIEPAASGAVTRRIRRYLEGRSSEPDIFADCPMVHMARLVVVDDLRPALGNSTAESLSSRYLLFIVELDGNIDDFLDRLYDVAPDFVHAVWGDCLGFPTDRKGPVFFRRYIESCSFKPNLPFAAFPNVSVLTITSALKLRADLMNKVEEWCGPPSRDAWSDFEASLCNQSTGGGARGY